MAVRLGGVAVRLGGVAVRLGGVAVSLGGVAVSLGGVAVSLGGLAGVSSPDTKGNKKLKQSDFIAEAENILKVKIDVLK